MISLPGSPFILVAARFQNGSNPGSPWRPCCCWWVRRMIGPPRHPATLAARSGGRLEAHAYPGAHHDFDAPDTPQRVLRGIGGTASGTATIGTHPAAREDSLRRVPEFLTRVMPAR
jgi:hypothetical protein